MLRPIYNYRSQLAYGVSSPVKHRTGRHRSRVWTFGLVAVLGLFGVTPNRLFGQILFFEDFDADHTANWAVNASPGTHPVNVFFDYSSVGIPSAPNSGGTTRGLKLQANTAGNVLGGVSVSPLGQNFTGNYRLHFDLWMNFNGPLNGGGNGTTQFGGAGVGVTGATPQWSGSSGLEGVWFAWTGEGGTTADYRAYSANSNNYVPASSVYFAGTSTSPDARNGSHPYYSGFGSKTAPAAQLSAYAQQTGSTPVGTLGFTWLDVTVTKSGNQITWAINGLPFAKVDASSFALSTNILFNYFDLNSTTSTDPNAPALLFALIDNVRVEVVPALFTVTGGGADCAGVPVGLSGSETAVEYRLSRGGLFTGQIVTGTGGALSFGNQTSSGVYTVIASNVISAATITMSGSASVTINQSPAITSGPTPASTVKSAGESVAFTITASGAGLSYQWQRDGTNLPNGGSISGATSSTLTINPVQPTDATDAGHGYTCVVNGTCAPAAVSSEALLSVLPLNRWRGDGAANQWNFSDANWFYGPYADGVTTIFDDAGSNNVPVNITTAVAPGLMLVASTGSYTFSGSGSISGSASLTKTNIGVLRLATSNSFTGNAFVLDGVLAVQHNQALGSTAGVTTVSNRGSVRIEGNGLLIAEPLTCLEPLYTDLTGFPTNSLLDNLANTNTWSGAITMGLTGENAPIKSSSGQLVLDSPTPIAGPGTLMLTGDGTTLVRSSVASSVPFIEAYPGGERYLYGDTYSTASLLILGSSTVVVTNGQIFNGSAFGIFCSSGRFETRGSTSLTAPLTLRAGSLRANGGTLTYSRTGNPKFSSDYNCSLETAGPSDQIVFNTAVQDDFGHAFGATLINGPGTVVLNAGDTGPNRYLGSWLLLDGTLKLNHPSALGGNWIRLSAGTVMTGVDGGGAFASSCLVDGNATIVIGRQTPGSTVSNYFGTLLVGTLGVPSTLTARPGAGVSPGGIAQLSFGNVDLGYANQSFRIQNQAGANCQMVFNGVVGDSYGPQALVKDGDGGMLLLAANTYRGGTVLSNGVLLVSNNTGSGTGTGDVTVWGGVLGGNGRIARSVVVKSNGVLAVGSSIGSLAISNTLTFEAGATNLVEVDLGTGTNDSVVGLTNVSYGGTLVVSNVGSQPFTNGAALKIFDALTYSGAFAAIVPNYPGPGLAWDTSTLPSDGTLRVQELGNSSPTVQLLIANQTNTYGGNFNFIFPTNTFTDPDAGQTLTYSASNLPPGILFTPATRTFAGTPTAVGSNWVTVTATDNGTPALSTNTSFAIVSGKAPLAISVNNASRAYGNFNPAFEIIISGLVLGDQWWQLAFYPYADSSATDGSPIGTYPITVHGGLDPNYEVTTADALLTVTNAPLVAVVASACRPVGQTNGTFTGTMIGGWSGDNLALEFSTAATPASPPGAYAIVPVINDPAGRLTNYAVTLINGTLTVELVDSDPQFTVLHDFGFTNLIGHAVSGELLAASDGWLYGADGRAVFRIQPGGSNYTLVRVLTAADGITSPAGTLIEDTNGVLYGIGNSTNSSAGAVWKMNRDGTGLALLHSFAGPPSDGASPFSVIEGSDGFLYGTTASGGANSAGTVFRLAKDGSSYALLYEFPNYLNGYLPNAPLIESTNGALYGVTGWGGAGGLNGGGVVFRIEKDGTGFQRLHSFMDGPTDGSYPRAHLLRASDGMLYGTTASGGPDFLGTIFRLNHDGSGYSVLKSFAGVWPYEGVDGVYPAAPLVEGTNGVLYSTTFYGGTNLSGVVFKLDKDGSNFAVLHDLGEGGDGGKDAKSSQTGLIQAPNGRLYGSARIKSVGPSGSAFYTLEGDGSNYAVIYRSSISGGDGTAPRANLREGSDGILYGSTSTGGANDLGTVFRIGKDGADYAQLHSFGGFPTDGSEPAGRVLEGADGWLYGTTQTGGSIDAGQMPGSGGGTVYRIYKDGTGFTLLHSFGSVTNDGILPRSGLWQDVDGMLYGCTVIGGVVGRGVIYKLNTNGLGYTILHDFVDSNSGYAPLGELVGDTNGFLYGATDSGGAGSVGVIFRLKSDGTSFTVLHDFDYPTAGFGGSGLLLASDNSLYGVTSAGGITGGGAVYKINRDGSGFQILYHFVGGSRDGSQPGGTLTEGSDGRIYGTTAAGGNDGFGIIFSLEKDGTGYCTLHHFVPTTINILSDQGVISGSDGNLYGFGANTGPLGFGNLFRLSLAANGRPVVGTPIANQTNSYGGVLNFTFAANTFTDPDAGQTLSYSASGLPPEISFDGPTRTFSGTNISVGNYSITVTATDDGAPVLSTNDVFDLVVEKVPLLASAENKIRGYGAANPPLTISYSGFVLGESEAVLGNPPLVGTGAAPGSPVGTYPITLTGGSDAHYSLTLSNGLLSVTNVSLVVTANDTNRPYGQTNPALTGVVSGVVNGDNITADFVTTATQASPPGAYPISPVFNDPNNRLPNYVVTTNLGVLTIDCAPTLTVTTTADSGYGSLRDCIANICPSGAVNFAVTGVIALTSDHLPVDRSVNIVGPGATHLTLNGGGSWQLFNVTTGVVAISGLTLANGSDSASFSVGAAVRNNANLTVRECVFTNNLSEASGGAIFNRPDGVLVVDRCLFVGNRAVGAFQGGGNAGAIANQGVMFITNSTFSGNSAGFTAGAIRNTGDMTIESSTFTANTASECTDCVGLPAVIGHSGSSAVLHNTIVGGNTNVLGTFRDVSGAMDGGDYNLVEFASGYVTTGTNDLLGVSPVLGPLADNGGPTWTHLPLPGSPVIDAGDPSTLHAVDQRGIVRPVNGRADIGAVEAPPPVTPPTLSIVPGVGNVTISWTPSTSGFVLQTNLTLNPFTWGDAASGSTNPIGVSLGSGQLFFRLRN